MLKGKFEMLWFSGRPPLSLSRGYEVSVTYDYVGEELTVDSKEGAKWLKNGIF